MRRFEENEIDLSVFRRNLLKFRENLRRSLGLPRRPARLLRERLILRRLPEEERPLKAIRRIKYTSHGVEEVYAEPPKGERPEAVSISPPTPNGRAPTTPNGSGILSPPPAPQAQPSERKRLIDAITELIEHRKEHSLRAILRRAVEAAVTETQKQMQLQTKKLELEIKKAEVEEEERRSRRRGLHW